MKKILVVLSLSILSWVVLLFIFCKIASAHDSEDVCPDYAKGAKFAEFKKAGFVGYQQTKEGFKLCIYPSPEASLDNLEFYRVWRQYWHERRELVASIGEMRECIGEVESLSKLLNIPNPLRDGVPFELDMNPRNDGVFQFMTDYYHIVPADPVREIGGHLAQGRMSKGRALHIARTEVKAASAGIANVNLLVEHCSALRDRLRKMLGA